MDNTTHLQNQIMENLSVLDGIRISPFDESRLYVNYHSDTSCKLENIPTIVVTVDCDSKKWSARVSGLHSLEDFSAVNRVQWLIAHLKLQGFQNAEASL